MKFFIRFYRKIKKKKKDLSLLFCTLVVLFLLLEIYLRIFFSLETDPFFNRGIITFGKIWKSSEDPIIGYELTPNSKSIQRGIEYKINSKGLRDYEYSYEKSEGTYRIVVLGDSVTTGFGVNLDELYVKQLEKLLNDDNKKNYEVINLGVGGYNTQQEFQWLKKEGLKYNPDLVIFSYLFNDISPKMVKNVTDDSEVNLCRISFTNTKIPCWIVDNLRKIRTLTFVKYRLNNILTKKEEKDYYYRLYYEIHSINDFDEIFANISQFSEDANLPVYFLIFPFIVSDYKQYPYKPIHKDLTEKLNEHNLKFIDILKDYSQTSKPIYISKIDRSHPNARGHRIAAEAIYKYLVKHQDILQR